MDPLLFPLLYWGPPVRRRSAINHNHNHNYNYDHNITINITGPIRIDIGPYATYPFLPSTSTSFRYSILTSISSPIREAIREVVREEMAKYDNGLIEKSREGHEDLLEGSKEEEEEHHEEKLALLPEAGEKDGEESKDTEGDSLDKYENPRHPSALRRLWNSLVRKVNRKQAPIVKATV